MLSRRIEKHFSFGKCLFGGEEEKMQVETGDDGLQDFEEGESTSSNTVIKRWLCSESSVLKRYRKEPQFRPKDSSEEDRTEH